ncbi:MAG: hypothetical protein PHH28_05580 [Desulfuromonadaceae bacterium]|nr:hypothetical protein [Desulfuromonadaceae bacterium]
MKTYIFKYENLIALASLCTAVITFTLQYLLLPWCKKRKIAALYNKIPALVYYDQQTIESSTKYFIKPKCSNVDPAQEAEIRHALVATKEDMFKNIDVFLNTSNPHKYLLILADSGMGKTSFMINYTIYNNKKNSNVTKVLLFPLSVNEIDKDIEAVNDKQNYVIFLDALDEDIKAIQDHHQRLLQLMQTCKNFRKVVISSRTQFFLSEEEIPVETGTFHLGPRQAGLAAEYKFWKVYISPFDDKDVDIYIKRRFPFWENQKRKIAQQIVGKIPYLYVRPMLLAHIPDIISAGITVSKLYEIYELMIDAWLEREKHWANKVYLAHASEILSKDIYDNSLRRNMEKISLDEVMNLCAKHKIPLKKWQLTGRSLLNRDAFGNFKFAHRSIMEYLYVKVFVCGRVSTASTTLTDQMKKFFFDIFDLDSNDTLLADIMSKYDMRIVAVKEFPKLFDFLKTALYRERLKHILDPLPLKNKNLLNTENMIAVLNKLSNDDIISIEQMCKSKNYKALAVQLVAPKNNPEVILTTKKFKRDNDYIILSNICKKIYGNNYNQSETFVLNEREIVALQLLHLIFTFIDINTIKLVTALKSKKLYVKHFAANPASITICFKPRSISKTTLCNSSSISL